MADYKVTKKYNKYAIVKSSWGEYFIVDVAEGCTLTGSYYLKSLKYMCEGLESGSKSPDFYDTVYNKDYMVPIDMPKSLKAHQAQLLSAKPAGSKAPSIVEVVDKVSYKIVKLSDGTFGYFIPNTGEYKLGYTNINSIAKSAPKAVKKAAANILAEQGVDSGSNAVDTLIDLYEMRVRDMYGRAASEMSAKLAKYMETFAEQDALKVAQVASGEISASDLKKWRQFKNAEIQSQKNMIDALTADLVSADKRAVDMLNGYVTSSYAENFNFATFQIEQATGMSTSFQLYNTSTVTNLLKNPEAPLLPTVDDAADMAWANSKISSCIAQSVLQGESVQAAAMRLAGVVGMGANTAVRAARTAMTGAQNLGRLDAGRRAKKMGIELKKQWVATHDERTRYSHRDIDRETVELEEKFSNGCMYPGDPEGEGFEVYNCRCAMRHVLPGHEYDDLPEFTKEGVAYEEWKNAGKLKTQAKKDKLQEQLDELEAQKNGLLNSLPENKTYSGIWKNDVTLEEYESKIDSIPKKKQFYDDKIADYQSKMDFHGGSNDSYDKIEYAHAKKHLDAAKKHLDELAEFEQLGKEYADAKKAVQGQIDAIDAQRKKLGEKMAKLTGRNDYSEERKAAALRWSDPKEADKHLRHLTEKAWSEATRAEKDGIWGYTDGSGKYNRPLSGFRGGWGPSNYVGVGKVDLDYEGGKQAIRDATSFISRCKTEDDFWVRRGCGTNAMDSFFGLEFGGITTMTNEELQGLVGHSNRIAGFLSCGTASESRAGFGGAVDMKIFIPKGTEAVYAEPFSSYSGASYNGKYWDGKQKQSYIGSEDETIIQRGASYTCTKVEKRGYNSFYVEMEVHPEDGYDLFGQED